MLHKPTSAAAEFSRLNSADSPAVCRVSSQCSVSTSGAMKMPPPIPVTPAAKPMAAPATSDGSQGGCGGVDSSAAAAERAEVIIRHAARIKSTPTTG